jgi:hypothetical protein
MENAFACSVRGTKILNKVSFSYPEACFFIAVQTKHGDGKEF